MNLPDVEMAIVLQKITVTLHECPDVCNFQQLDCLFKSSLIPKQSPGGRLNKKDGLTRYGDSHVKDKTS